MTSGYVNFPKELFTDDGQINFGKVDGIYNKMVELMKLNKPFFTNLKVSSQGITYYYVGCPTVRWFHPSESFLIEVGPASITFDTSDVVQLA